MPLWGLAAGLAALFIGLTAIIAPTTVTTMPPRTTHWAQSSRISIVAQPRTSAIALAMTMKIQTDR